MAIIFGAMAFVSVIAYGICRYFMWEVENDEKNVEYYKALKEWQDSLSH